MGSHQKSARMKVCTISDNSTMAGHKPEPIALSRNESPSNICQISDKSIHTAFTGCSERLMTDPILGHLLSLTCRIQWAQLTKRDRPSANT